MKIMSLMLVAGMTLGVCTGISAQDSKSKKEKKHVEYRNENGKRTLTVITNENGKEKKEVYTGEEADRRMEEISTAKNFTIIAGDDDVRINSDDNGVHVFSGEGDNVSVISKDGKMIIKHLDQNGKEEMEEIDIQEHIDKAMSEMHVRLKDLDSLGVYSFNFDNMDMAKFEVDMEKFEKEMELHEKSMEQHEQEMAKAEMEWKKTESKGVHGRPKFRTYTYSSSKPAMVIKEEESLTPAEIKEKYGVDVKGDEDKVVVKKVITVKKDRDGDARESTGVGSNNAAFGEIKVFPNPSTGVVKLNFNNKNGNTSCVVKDMKGRTVYQQEFKSKGQVDKELDLNHLSSGSYNITLKNGGNVVTKKIVIE